MIDPPIGVPPGASETPIKKPKMPPGRDTWYLTVADKDGNVCSLIGSDLTVSNLQVYFCEPRSGRLLEPLARASSRWRYMFFTSMKVASSCRTPLQMAPAGVLT